MPVHNVRSGWSAGDLIFHEDLVKTPATGYNVLTVGDDAVTVGDGTNDIDFKVFLGSTDKYADFNFGTSTITFAGVDVALSGDLTVTVEDISLADDNDLEFGTGTDVLMRFSTGDDSDHALVLALDNTSQQMHITDKAAVATDWGRTAGTHPELAIHSNTTPITDYLAIGNHDGTTAHIDVMGGTTLSLDIAGTPEVVVAAASTSPATTDSNALGTTALMWSDLFLATAGVINWNDGDATLTHSASKLTYGNTVNNANLGDGYGIFEVDTLLTGATAGHTASSSSWLNINSTVGAGGHILAARNDGIWVNGGDAGDSTNALVVYGARMSYIGDGNSARLSVFSVNVSGGDTCEGVFMTVNGDCATELGYSVDAGTSDTKIGGIPFFVDNATGNQYWVRIYDGPG